MIEKADKELVNLTLEGDTNAFGSIIDKYQKKIFNLSLRMLNDYDDAKDITQSVFIKAYEKLKLYNPKYKFFSWLYRMAVNESLNMIKQKKRIDSLQRAKGLEDNSTEEMFENHEFNIYFQRALQNLKPEYRTVIILKHLNGLSYKEISEITDVPEKTVKSRLFSARRLLKEELIREGYSLND